MNFFFLLLFHMFRIVSLGMFLYVEIVDIREEREKKRRCLSVVITYVCGIVLKSVRTGVI